MSTPATSQTRSRRWRGLLGLAAMLAWVAACRVVESCAGVEGGVVDPFWRW